MTLSLSPNEARWVDFIAKTVVPSLPGAPADKARTAAVVTWWALKEGVLDLPNPLRHNLCSQAGEVQIGDLGVCSAGPWQIGISGIQGNAVSDEQVEDARRRAYGSESVQSTLSRIAKTARVDSATYDAIVRSTGALRRAWLLRDGAVSFPLQRPFVEACLASSPPSWCFGSWDTARAYASDPTRIDEVMRALGATFAPYANKSASTRALPWLIVAAGVGLLGYGYVRENGWPNFLRGLP